MGNSHDVTPVSCTVYFIPVQARVPLKFGAETLTHVTCVRVCMEVRDTEGRRAEGWGETPISVQWAWPGPTEYESRKEQMMQLCREIAVEWPTVRASGHPVEIGYDFLERTLPSLAAGYSEMPRLAALICASAFDLALHDAYGMLHSVPVYQTYNKDYMSRDLSAFLEDANGDVGLFVGKYPEHFLASNGELIRRSSSSGDGVNDSAGSVRAEILDNTHLLPVWHLLGGMDPIDVGELSGSEPHDGYPLLLHEWIERDGLYCVKVKLRGDDSDWDFKRLVEVGRIARQTGVVWLSADFNCTVRDPGYVTGILDQLMLRDPVTYQKVLYVEQPFPYDLESNPIDVHPVSARKPLFMDESAHDWRLIRFGRTLGWTGVALKTCKTQTGALLSLSWAKAHGMTVMVQDLTNPMLAQIPHVLLAQYAGTIMGVESNSMQFYPEASKPEAAVHPGIYQRTNGMLNLSTLTGPGFGYRLAEIKRELPPYDCRFQAEEA